MDKVKNFWDKNAKRYDKSEIKFQAIFKEILLKTINYLNKEDTVLDYGCATGTKTLELAKYVKMIYGLDISTQMIIEAKNKCKKYDLKGRLPAFKASHSRRLHYHQKRSIV